MSTEVVKELFRNLENVLHDRLKVIEDILSLAKQSQHQHLNPNSTEVSHSSLKINDLEARLHSLDEYTMGQVRTLAFNHDQLENTVKHLESRIHSLESSMRSAVESFQVINATMGLMQTRMDDGKPVEAAEAEAEIDEAQEAALNAETDAVVVEKRAKASFSKAVEQLEEEVEEEDATSDEEEEVVEEEEEEEVEEEEEEEEEEEVEEEEVEEEEVEEEEVEEESPYEHIFTFEEVDYYLDKTTNNVYIPDEDGGVDPEDIKGIWSASTEKMWIPLKKKWWDYKTNKYTEPKTKK